MFPSFRVTLTRCAAQDPIPIRTDRQADESMSDGGGFHRDLSLGSCGHVRFVWALTCAYGYGEALRGWVAFTVVPRCSPSFLVR
jgi:hypothetical protein